MHKDRDVCRTYATLGPYYPTFLLLSKRQIKLKKNVAYLWKEVEEKKIEKIKKKENNGRKWATDLKLNVIIPK